ncbi:50S ribosomal protein L25/general stress protein Ctc [Nigerium massiliense]|uniref:50S ribosomal protein L25/general stress protein Ctc n=1 Tax=Nigerium massiliense TaxID=1522317 RepID=UPI00058FED7E|nr:50S ribosomal protein L25/general stress protein Ctc [Nigerium massiliense]
MADEIKIEAESRTEFGKGAARRIRRDNKVPAVIYGHGTDPIHITLPGHETLLALRTANALLSITIDGGRSGLALPKQVQRDPIRGFLEHVDLVTVRRGETVTVEVPVQLVGEDKPDNIVNLDAQVLEVDAPAIDIPSNLEVDITDLVAGDQVLAKDLKLPEGTVFNGDPDLLIVSVSQAKSEEELEAELDEAVSEATEEGEEPEAEAADEASEEGESSEESEGDSEGDN